MNAMELTAGVLAGVGYIVTVTLFIAAKAGKKEVSQNFKEVYKMIEGFRKDYVRRDDLGGHLKHLENSIEGVRRDQREMKGLMLQVISNGRFKEEG